MKFKAKNGHYKAHGLLIKSSIYFPELYSISQSIDIDYDLLIKEDKIYREDALRNIDKKTFTVRNDILDYAIPDIGFIRVVRDKKIIVDRKGGPVDRVTRLFILGIGLSIALHRRGRLVLHSSAVKMNDSAVLFMGASGAGKSTLAAAFACKGHDIVADDVSSIKTNSENILYSGVNRLKLWKDSLPIANQEKYDFEKAHPDIDKFLLTPKEINDNVECTIKGILSLEYGDEISIKRLPPKKSFSKIVKYSYVPKNIVKSLGDQERHFDQCLNLAKSNCIYNITRPKDYSKSDEVVQIIEEVLGVREVST